MAESKKMGKTAPKGMGKTPAKAVAKKPATKAAPKKPTGELPKRNSALAKFIKGSASGKGFTQAEARTAAGKYRNMEKAAGGFGGFGSMDKSGVALGKAEAATKAMRKPAAKTTSRGAKAGSSTVSKVVKRAKTVAREVRDIPTAAGSIIASRDVPKGAAMKYAKKDLKTQIKEVGSAIKSGKKGTAAAQARYGSVKKGYTGGGGLDYNVSKPKAKRK